MATRKLHARAVIAVALVLAAGGSFGIYRAAAGGGTPAPAPGASDKGAEGQPVGGPARDGKKLDNRPAALTSRDLQALLRKPVDLEKPLDAVPLKDFFDMLGQKFNLPVRVDLAAFAHLRRGNGLAVYDVQVKLPITRGMSVADALRDALAQVSYQNEGPFSPVTYRVHDGAVLVVPAYVPQLGDDPANCTIPFDQIYAQEVGEPVSVVADDKPLAAVLEELRRTTGANIVLDNRQKERAQHAVTAVLTDVPLLTALRVLADPCELRPVAMHNVYYVTSPENADRIRKEYRVPTGREPEGNLVPAPKNP